MWEAGWMHFLRSPSLLSSLSCVRRTGAESGCSCPSPAAAATVPTVPSPRKKRLPPFLPLVPTRRCRESASPPPLLAFSCCRGCDRRSSSPPLQPPSLTHRKHTQNSEQRAGMSAWSPIGVGGRGGGRSLSLPQVGAAAGPSAALCLPPFLSQQRRSAQSIDIHPTIHKRDRPLRTCCQPLSGGLTWGGGGGMVPPSGSGSCSACSRSQPCSLGSRLSSTPPTRKRERGEGGAQRGDTCAS